MKSETTVEDFYLYCEYLKLKNEKSFQQPSPDHYYLAQIAREIRCVLMESKHSRNVKLNDFLLKFSNLYKEKKPKENIVRKPKRSKKLSNEDQRKERALRSKAFWFTALGFDKKVTYGKEDSAGGTGSPNNG